LDLVILFIILYANYGNNSLLDNSDIQIDENTKLLNLLNTARNNAKNQVKEKFAELTQDEAMQYLDQVNSLQYWVDNNYAGTGGIRKQIQNMILDYNKLKDTNNQDLLNLLTNMYMIAYIDHINHQNVESYKVFNKYRNPKNNKYYSQFIGD
jgi:hypothetical protein